ncbi:MAG: MerR family transcriptional regulator [Oscillospiraceae bacterium]|jgi:DNA-binding transcriptional MerR regulator|nr:MerR family transcriptional regulator [Oscillospiraceae bacterium]
MLLIGEFAQKNGVSAKLLRHYDAEGVLKPERTDEWTGYRLYGEGQEKYLRWILLLRNVGLTLREIKTVLSGPADSAALLRLLREKRADSLLRYKAEITRGLQIGRLITFLEKGDFSMEKTVDLMSAPIADVREIMRNMPNDIAVVEKAEELIGKTPEIVLFRGDIWHMKAVNDNHGHDAGDRVIAAFYNAIVSGLAELPDGAMGRSHGDEFTGVFPGGAEDAERVLQKIAAAYAGSTVEGVPGGMLGSRFGAVAGAVTKETLRLRLHETVDAVEDARRAGKDAVTVRRL